MSIPMARAMPTLATYSPITSTSLWNASAFNAQFMSYPQATPQSRYVDVHHRGSGGNPEPDEPNFRPPRWAYAAAATLLLALSGCEYFKKQKLKGVAPPDEDGHAPAPKDKTFYTCSELPKKAFVIRKSKTIRVKPSGKIYRGTKNYLIAQAKQRAERALRKQAEEVLYNGIEKCRGKKAYVDIVERCARKKKVYVKDGMGIIRKVYFEYWMTWEFVECRGTAPHPNIAYRTVTWTLHTSNPNNPGLIDNRRR